MDRATIDAPTDWATLSRFAQSLHQERGATRVLLFGSRARGAEHADSDFDVVIVSPGFAAIPRRQRARGLRSLWLRAGGSGPVDMICMTPEEFEDAQNGITLIRAILPEAVDLLPPE